MVDLSGEVAPIDSLDTDTETVIKSHDSYVLVCTEESCNIFGCEELYLSGCEADLLCTFISSTLKNYIFVNAGSEQNLRQDRLHASA